MSTVPAVDPRPHAAAIKAAIDAQLVISPETAWHAYSYGQVPGDPDSPNEAIRRLPLPDIFVLVAVERRYVPPRRSTGQTGRSSWRVNMRGVGRSVTESSWALNRISEALDDAVLTVSGVTTTPLLFESSTAPEPGNGRFSGFIQYTYTA